MVIRETKKALESHLGALLPTLPTAYEAVSFTPPDTMYQRTQFVINDPDDPVLGTGYYRERIQFQVFVVDVVNQGTGSAIARAELIRGHFTKGTTLMEGTHRIYVLDTPRVAGAAVVDGRVIVPVLINVVTEVYSG